MKVSFQAIEGYAYGCLQPSLLLKFPLEVATEEKNTQALQRLLEAIEEQTAERAHGTSRSESLIEGGPANFAKAVTATNGFCGDRQFRTPKPFEENGFKVFSIPTLSTDLAWHNMVAISEFLKKSKAMFSTEQVAEWLEDVKKKHRHYLPGGTNTMNFIAAAIEHGLPVKVFRRDYLIFGYGSGSRMFRSSIVDCESSVGVSLASSKADTNRLLKLSGLPVADQARIRTLQQAHHFASRIGYPVVVKPDNGSQGRGIFADIRDAEELAQCFAKLKESYDTILIEKHISGDHYRIDYMGEDLIKAVRRRAPRVVGDGVSTVRALLDRLNTDPERLDPYSSKKIVTVDEDLERCLSKQDLSLDSTPSQGQSVYLKSISNLSRGGSQEHVEDMVHAANYEMCRGIARIMRLEVLGIDILSEDLSQPWYSNGAVICEVNAQPQLGASGTTVYWNLLEKYVGPRARIDLSISQKPIGRPKSLYDTSLSAIELNLSAREVLEHGCPTQYFDSLTISEDVPEPDRRALHRLLVSVEPGPRSGRLSTDRKGAPLGRS